MTDVAVLYVRWSFVRALFHRGWWLVTSLYLVVDAGLSPFELIFVGTAQQLVGISFEIPAGVLADTVSRKWSVVVAHFLMGTAMLTTGLVTSFPLLVGTQMLWGLSWTFSSGADVAWLTDELREPERTARVLTRAARYEQVGAAAGLIALGAWAWAAGLSAAIVTAGAAMCALGAVVAWRFPERGFTPTRARRWRASLGIFRRGFELARRDRQILVVFAATLLTNGAGDVGRLFPKQLLDLGLPGEPAPIVWLTGLGLVTLAVAALALRGVEARIDGAGAARRSYAAACAVAALGLGVLALAPDPFTGMAGILLVEGIGWGVTRTISVVWVNRRTSSDVRATVHSFLAQVEYLGEIGIGLSLGILAQAAGIPAALLASAALVAATFLLVARSDGG